MEPILRHAATTDVGRVREKNEDAYLADADARLFLVADGMGGHASGEVASRMAVEELQERIGALATEAGPEQAREAIDEALRETDRLIHRRGQENPEHSGMGTTATAILFLADGACVLGHVGDSRAYRLRDDELEQITRDHSWVQEQVDSGNLTKEAARIHPAASMLTRALGTSSEAEPDLYTEEWAEGDLYLLASDGLTGLIQDETIRDGLAADASLEERAEGLVREANEAGGTDNITVVLVEVVGAE